MKILDATAGNRGIWFNKNCSDATYMDIRPEVKPDIVGDCTKTDFPDKHFDLIVFDPPHFKAGPKSQMAKIYGQLNAREIRDLIEDGFKEFHRILKDNGFVLFKWNDHDQKLDKILRLILNFEPLFGQKVSVRTKHSSATYWVCLRKTTIIQKRVDNTLNNV